jgi:hypothetical protein
MKFQIEVVQRTFFIVTADSEDAAIARAFDWATHWGQQACDAIIDGRGGIEAGDIVKLVD